MIYIYKAPLANYAIDQVDLRQMALTNPEGKSIHSQVLAQVLEGPGEELSQIEFGLHPNPFQKTCNYFVLCYGASPMVESQFDL